MTNIPHTAQPVGIDREEAVAAATAAAFTVTDPEDSRCGRVLLHCFIGTMGASWDLDRVLELIGRATDITWSWSMFEHELSVYVDGRAYTFEALRSKHGREALATPPARETVKIQARVAPNGAPYDWYGTADTGKTMEEWVALTREQREAIGQALIARVTAENIESDWYEVDPDDEE
jgi:hypothetical protein